MAKPILRNFLLKSRIPKVRDLKAVGKDAVFKPKETYELGKARDEKVQELTKEYTGQTAKKTAMTLAGKLAVEKRLPTKPEILQGITTKLKETISNPINAFKEGLKKDKYAVGVLKELTGKGRFGQAKTYGGAIGKGVYGGGGKDLAVNTGGFLGSIAGAQIGGLPLGLAGDYAGARLTRRSLDNIETRLSANKIRQNPSFRQQPKDIQKQILQKRREGFKRKIEDDVVGDRLGWGIGNGAAEGLRAMGVGIPLKGAAAAAALVAPAQGGLKVLDRTKDSKKAVEAARRRFLKRVNVKKNYEKGVNRETKMYDSVDKQLKKLPSLPPNIQFSRHLSLVQLVDKRIQNHQLQSLR